jgi:hypothetical protein
MNFVIVETVRGGSEEFRLDGIRICDCSSLTLDFSMVLGTVDLHTILRVNQPHAKRLQNKLNLVITLP